MHALKIVNILGFQHEYKYMNELNIPYFVHRTSSWVNVQLVERCSGLQPPSNILGNIAKNKIIQVYDMLE